MENNLTTEWTLPVLARQVHVSGSHLTRIFKSATGLPPMAYLSRIRGNHATRLLLNSDLSIAEIALQSG